MLHNSDPILGVAARFLGWRYSAGRPRVPFHPHPAFPTSLVAPGQMTTNCSTFTACVLMAVYPDAEWDRRSYGELQLFANDDGSVTPDAPVQAVVRADVGAAVAPPTEQQPLGGGWHLVQGWEGLQPPTGHAFFLHRHQDDGWYWMLHASSQGGRGPVLAAVHVRKVLHRYPAGLYCAQLDAPR